MSIDKNTVGKIARLARIKVSEEEKEVLSAQLSNILKMIEELNAVNTDGVEPLTSVVQMQMYEREDKVTDGGIPEKILQNAPEQTAGFFVVPKVVE
ncbi:MAG: Asp-tRNA(Asn)/Glu-tRNA(Gln) amidotransferase subunit GatC [Alphaproteobacteria bacterium]|nr:MAG: Asp-tRNA(Asn)/Glu-tRNA(Gln) amidotransferase subunit GatC [Alphaproteobacteria bacterium]